jgi:hypothetical protein
MRKTFAVTLAILTLGCEDHRDVGLTDWLKVDVARPSGGDSGVIKVGQSSDVFRARVEGQWRDLGTGHSSSYMLVAAGTAALVDLHDGTGAQLIRSGESALRPLRDVLQRTGDISVVPGGVAVDVFDCRIPAQPAGCREVEIARFDFDGNRVTAFDVRLPEAYSDCQLMAIRAYDGAGVPYVSAQCAMNSRQAKCLWAAPRKDGLFVEAVRPDRPWSECADLPAHGTANHPPETFTVLR